jgi:CBS domain-containing protein
MMRPITAADLMNPHILSVRDDLTIAELTSFLVRNEITGAPVENAGGRLVGMVSVSDLAEASLDPPREDQDGPGGDSRAVPGVITVREIMAAGLASVSEDATVSEVASKMLDGGFHRIVVTRGGEPLGIITTSDLLGLLIDER